MANGMGLMGEAGPEAVMPLKRGKGGRLGVEATGGGTNVVVNVDASGSEVQGSDEQGRVLGKLIAAAINSTLIKEKRPGGLLAA
jgi:phage-related minor tail protein